ncbi:MAG TPA: hypothetical protein ENF73_07000, partial [Proteobacteria bacterium]|nr:hypothetical protein [Pseudomonadota bacterium]
GVLRAVVDGAPVPETPELTDPSERPVIAGWQDEDGDYAFAAATGQNLREAALNAARKLLDKADIPASARLYVSVIYKRSRMPESKKTKRVFRYGLYGLAKNFGDKTCFIPPEIAFYRSMKLNKAKRMLDESPPCCIDGSYGPSGYFRFRSKTAVERADGSVALLFRGSYLVKPDDLTPEFVRKNIKLAADFLVRMIREDGRYYYRYYPAQDRLDRTGYNLLRHAGTTYSLYQACRHLAAPKYCDAAERAWEWLKNQMKIERKDNGIIAYPEYRGKVKLGGAGLSLICLAERAKATGRYDEQLAERLANFIEYMQKPNGDVYYYYDPVKRRGVDKRKAFYYPGEATLGMVRLYQVDKKPRYLEIAKRTADFLIDRRWKILGIEVAVPPDAWLTMALAELYEIDGDPKYARYALKLTDRMLSEQLGEVRYPDYDGGFVKQPPGSTPAGGRMEAVTAAYYLAKKLGVDTSRIEESILRATRFQINCIVREEDSLFYPNPRRALGLIKSKPTIHKVRIDYNQHNISSLIFEMKILEEIGARMN